MKKWLIFILLISMYGCNDNSSDIRTYKSFPEEINLASNVVVGSSSIECVFSTDMFIRDSMLFLLDNGSPVEPISEYSFPGIQLKNKYGTKGRGPGEFLGATQLTINNNGIISLLSAATGKFINYDINSGSNKFVSENSLNVGFKPILAAFKISDTTYAVPNIQSEHQVHIINTKGERLYSIFRTPEKQDAYDLYQMALAFDGINNLIVGGSRLGEILNIYNFNTCKSHELVGPKGLPKWEKATKGRAIAGPSNGFMKIQIVNNKIFGLFSGISVHDRSKKVQAAKYMHVYSLDGEPLTKYILDRAISSFHIYEDKIYGMDLSEDAPLYVFDL